MIDWDRVNELREEVGAEDFLEVAELFLEEVDELIRRLAANPDPAELEENMHFLKGSALNLGFAQMAQACQQGERAAAVGQLDARGLNELLAIYEQSKSTFAAQENIKL
ncbi:Hpt domain-containing protein [Falsihalocynthiibacter sp. SS001]|uniref:Hpt domain-containing protein n=1 Tax=Falsihalocynthiibacter sp. SS001 TaxID=3349698 RepID=UPI0036D29DF9